MPEGPEGQGGPRDAAPNAVRTPSLAGGRALRHPEHPWGTHSSPEHPWGTHSSPEHPWGTHSSPEHPWGTHSSPEHPWGAHSSPEHPWGAHSSPAPRAREKQQGPEAPQRLGPHTHVRQSLTG